MLFNKSDKLMTKVHTIYSIDSLNFVINSFHSTFYHRKKLNKKKQLLIAMEVLTQDALNYTNTFNMFNHLIILYLMQ